MNKFDSLFNETKGKTIVAVTKYVSSLDARELFSFGFNNMGENRVDEFLKKYDDLSDLNITWHFIGHLQRNKAKLILNKIDYLHSLDSLELAKIIDKERVNPLPCFIELKLTDNKNKHGVKEEDLDNFMDEIKKYSKVKVIGFMAMSDKGQSDDEIKEVFHKANILKDKYNLKYLSMGMSDDYKIALSIGTTHLRLGRILFR